MQTLHLSRALLPSGWTDRVLLELDGNGTITRVTTGVAAPPHAQRLGLTVPGMANLHSHAFQRGMAGLAERRGSSPDTDSFWSWREIMYAFLDRLEPADVEALAALAQCEMLESGFTAVAEFHYLHHDPAGRPYQDPGEMAGAVVAAAARTGIALTLLPAYYRYGGFGQTPTGSGQRRFVTHPEEYVEIFQAAGRHLTRVEHGVLGLAPHSLRAAPAQEINDLLTLAPGGPVHIHAAEQPREVAESLAHLGARPVAHLLDSCPVGPEWCLVHCTHLEREEVRALAASGAVVGLCPVTEANLGDGIFPAAAFLEAGGRFGVGSDSNVRIGLADELRMLEYGQRLSRRERNVLAPPGESTGARLFRKALAGGAQAVGQAMGEIAPGARADLAVLATEHPFLAGRQDDAVLDAWIFAGDARVVREVRVGGRVVVEAGRALARDEAEAAYRSAVTRLVGGRAP